MRKDLEGKEQSWVTVYDEEDGVERIEDYEDKGANAAAGLVIGFDGDFANYS